jgi:hypothetical protein
MVVKGLLDISTSIIVAALKKLDLPTLVLPHIAISILSPTIQNKFVVLT